MGFSRFLKSACALGAFAALSLGLFAAEAPAQDVIKIGFVGSLTGSPFTADGIEGLNGAKLAVKEINAAGGVALELLVYDTKEMTPDAVVSAFNRIEGNDEISATVIASSVDRGRYLGKLILNLEKKGKVAGWNSEYVALKAGMTEDPAWLERQARVARRLYGSPDAAD